MAADVSGGGHGPGITAPGCGHEAEKGASSRMQFFESDLTLPHTPPLLLQDSGAQPQDRGQDRGCYITTVVICGRDIVALSPGVWPQGAAATPTKVCSRAPFCIFLALV